VGKMKFYHFWPPRKRSIFSCAWKNPLLAPRKQSFRRPRT